MIITSSNYHVNSDHQCETSFEPGRLSSFVPPHHDLSHLAKQAPIAMAPACLPYAQLGGRRLATGNS